MNVRNFHPYIIGKIAQISGRKLERIAQESKVVECTTRTNQKLWRRIYIFNFKFQFAIIFKIKIKIKIVQLNCGGFSIAELRIQTPILEFQYFSI